MSILLGEKLLVLMYLFSEVSICKGSGGDVFLSFGAGIAVGVGITSEWRAARDGSQISLYISSAILWCSSGVSFLLRCSVAKGACVRLVISPIGVCCVMCRSR